MTQRFFHTLTHFVVVLTALFLAFGPLLGQVAYAQLPTAEYEPPTTGYVPFTEEGVGLEVFGGPGPEIEGAITPSDDTPAGEGGGDTDDDTPPDTTDESIGVAQAISLSNSKNFETIYNFFVMAGGWVAGLGGMLFDIAFNRLVLEFGCWFVKDAEEAGCIYGASGVGGAVNQLWTVVRDLFNLVFIFSLVYIGLRLIVSADETTTQKTVGMLIAAALLVNFSLYIGKVVIDISNFTAVQIHDAMVGGFTYVDGGYEVTTEVDTEDGRREVPLIGSTGKESISGAFMQVLYISSFFSGKSLVSDGAGSLLVGVLAFIFLCYLGFVLAYGAVMVTVRFIALIILLIFSPAMFLGWVLPQFEQYSSKWRTNFVSYCFFIPAFVFLLYTSLFVLIQLSEALRADAGVGGYGGVIAGKPTADGWTIFLLYVLGVGFLHASTKVAGMMAKSGAVVGMKSASNIANKFTAGAAIAASTMGIRSAGGWAGRGVVGGLGGGLLKKASEGWEKKTGKSNQITRGLRMSSDTLRSKKYGGYYSYSDKEKAQETGNRRAAGLRARNEAEGVLNNLEANDAAKQHAIAQLDKNDIVEMSKTSDGKKLLVDNAQYLTADHIKALSDDKEQDRAAVAEIKAARSSAVQGKIKQPDEKDESDTKKEFKDLNSDDLAALSVNTLKEPNYVVHLDDDKIKKLPLVEAEKEQLKGERKKRLTEIAKGEKTYGGMNQDSLLKKLSPEKISKLPKGVFEVESFVQKLPYSVLKSKAFAEMDNDVQSNIRSILLEHAAKLPSSLPDTELDRIAEIDNWLRNSPQGKSFGT